LKNTGHPNGDQQDPVTAKQAFIHSSYVRLE
jgi:hypothetical protein